MTVYSDSGYLGNEDPLNGVFGHIDNGKNNYTKNKKKISGFDNCISILSFLKVFKHLNIY